MREEQILKESPDVPAWGGGKWAVYSTGCAWWTSFPDDLGKTPKIRKYSLPCCPHCGALLMQAPLEKFIDHAKKNPSHYGEKGIEVFFATHERNAKTCHKKFSDYVLT